MKTSSYQFARWFFLLAIVSGCGKSLPATLTKEAAVKQAQETFDAFVQRYQNPQPGDELFAVKVRIKDPHGVEDLWVTDAKLDSEPYSGTIRNDADLVKSVQRGQDYSFKKADVCDWMYLSNGVMQGNYILRAELEALPPNAAAGLKKSFGW